MNIFTENNAMIIQAVGIIAAIFGSVVIITLWIIDYCREKNFEELIKSRLCSELETNLEHINDDIFIIKHKLFTSERLAGIENLILNSLINTLKIVILPRDATDYLWCFNVASKNINTALKIKDLELMLKELLTARYWLIKSFKPLGVEQSYNKYLLKGIRHQLTQKDIA